VPDPAGQRAFRRGRGPAAEGIVSGLYQRESSECRWPGRRHRPAVQGSPCGDVPRCQQVRFQRTPPPVFRSKSLRIPSARRLLVVRALLPDQPPNKAVPSAHRRRRLLRIESDVQSKGTVPWRHQRPEAHRPQRRPPIAGDSALWPKDQSLCGGRPPHAPRRKAEPPGLGASPVLCAPDPEARAENVPNRAGGESCGCGARGITGFHGPAVRSIVTVRSPHEVRLACVVVCSQGCVRRCPPGLGSSAMDNSRNQCETARTRGHSDSLR